MDNLYVTQHFDWDPSPTRAVSAVNKLLAGAGLSTRLTPTFTGHMTSLEQRINLFHLLSQVLSYNVPGDIVEVGTHSGMTAAMLAMNLRELDDQRTLHVFDAFQDPTIEQVHSTFDRLQLARPAAHAGWVNETIPAELPPQIAFFNLDLGPGRSADLLEEDLYYALVSLYDRMTPGAIGVFQDYCDPEAYERPGYHFPSLIFHRDYWNLYPQVKRACDRFFHDKPEQVFPLYAGNYSHGYFRKKINRTRPQDTTP